MSIASMVVEIKEGASDAVLGGLGRISRVTVFGIKEEQIVVVVEGETLKDVDDVVREISQLADVIGVYPVFAGDHE